MPPDEYVTLQKRNQDANFSVKLHNEEVERMRKVKLGFYDKLIFIIGTVLSLSAAFLTNLNSEFVTKARENEQIFFISSTALLLTLLIAVFYRLAFVAFNIETSHSNVLKKWKKKAETEDQMLKEGKVSSIGEWDVNNTLYNWEKQISKKEIIKRLWNCVLQAFDLAAPITFTIGIVGLSLYFQMVFFK